MKKDQLVVYDHLVFGADCPPQPDGQMGHHPKVDTSFFTQKLARWTFQHHFVPIFWTFSRLGHRRPGPGGHLFVPRPLWRCHAAVLPGVFQGFALHDKCRSLHCQGARGRERVMRAGAPSPLHRKTQTNSLL